MPSEPHLFTVTCILFLELFRLFQIVGKIDDTLALLNLVSLSFGSWAGAPPPGARAGGSPWVCRAGPPAALSRAPSLPGLHDDHHLPAVHSESPGLPAPGPPQAHPPSTDPRTRPPQSSQTPRQSAWTTWVQRSPGACWFLSRGAGGAGGGEMPARPPETPASRLSWAIPASDPASAHPAAPGFGGRAVL